MSATAASALLSKTPPKQTRRAEGRGRPGRILGERGEGWTLSRATLPTGFARVNATAHGAVRTRFTALLRHVDVEPLERAFWRQKRRASAGVDGITVEDHERDLEDEIVQGAVAEVSSAVYEADFFGFSCGCRPGRNPHQALSSLHTAIMSQRVNWMLDADVRSLFASVDHEWLLRMVAHRIADPRVLRSIRLVQVRSTPESWKRRATSGLSTTTSWPAAASANAGRGRQSHRRGPSLKRAAATLSQRSGRHRDAGAAP